MLLPPTAKLPDKVGLGFGFFFLLLITKSSQLIHFEQKQGVDHSIITPNFQTVPVLEICYPLPTLPPTSTKRNR